MIKSSVFCLFLQFYYIMMLEELQAVIIRGELDSSQFSGLDSKGSLSFFNIYKKSEPISYPENSVRMILFGAGMGT